jgi:hypothetical protein
MALKVTRKPVESLLDLGNADETSLYSENHILEPEYHQDKYVLPCEETKSLPGAFQIGNLDYVVSAPYRGTQPDYADDETDPDSLRWIGMVNSDGNRVESGKDLNICALKSNCIRFGYIDTSLARSVSKDFHEKKKERASVIKNDILINSTGDGTIGRVAVFNYNFPAVVDGHITIVRFKDPIISWYVAAYLLSKDGQNQIYRYINGSSGQVEIYPQDIARIWIKPAKKDKMKVIADLFKLSCEKHDEFYMDLKSALSKI